MELIDRQIFALAEAMILWDFLSHHENWTKISAIEYLHRQGLLYSAYYTCGCPLCDEFRYETVACSDCPYETVACSDCPWPGEGKERCIDPDSPYYTWEDFNTAKNARAVFNLLSTLKIG